MTSFSTAGAGPVSVQIQAERESLELRRLQEASRELEVKAERRDQEELVAVLAEADRLAKDRAERAAAARRADAVAAAQTEEERRRGEAERHRREAHEERVRTGKLLADKAVESVPGLDSWDRLEIRRAVAAALEKASDTEPLQNVVDNALSIQLRLHGPLKVTEPPRAPASPINPPAPTSADVTEPDDEPDDDEEDDEVCDDPNCPECAAADAGGSGWIGLAITLAGIAVLAGAKHLADKRPAAPPTPPSTG